MAVAPTPQRLAGDVFCCLGLGFAVALLYDGALFLLGRSRPVRFVLDVLAPALAAVLLCGFSAARSASGAPRWYMLAALPVGAAAYSRVLAPLTARLRQLLLWAAALPLRLAVCLFFRPLLGKMAGAGRAAAARLKKIFVTNAPKQLKKTRKVLYNSN